MIDRLCLHEARAERRHSLAADWNAIVADEGFTWDERRAADSFIIFAVEWAGSHVHPDDQHWFERTFHYGYPESDAWEPDVDDEDHPEFYECSYELPGWHPSEWMPPSIPSDN